MAAALGVLRTLSTKFSLPLATEGKYNTESVYYKRLHENDTSAQAYKLTLQGLEPYKLKLSISQFPFQEDVPNKLLFVYILQLQ